MASSTVRLHLVFRQGIHVWKTAQKARRVERMLCCWPKSNAGITTTEGTNEDAWFGQLRIERFQTMRKMIPMTHAVLIDPHRGVLDAWLRLTGMPCIHVSRNYVDDLAYEQLGHVLVSSLYSVQKLLEKEDEAPTYSGATYSGFDLKAKCPMVVPVYGIPSMVYLHHALTRLKQEIVCCDDEAYAWKTSKHPRDALSLFNADR